MSDPTSPPDLDAIRAARERIASYVHRTPVLTSSRLDAAAGARLFFKCENFQKTGSFKARGAHNAVFALSEAEASGGVLTHSSGNHGAALALAARSRGIMAHIVVPENALASKVAAIRGYGGQIVFCENTLAARESTVEGLRQSTGAAMIHPYNNVLVIAGQGTAGLELLEEAPDLQIVMAPVGGGGLLSGTAIAVKGVNATIRVLGVEPAAAADAANSLHAGRRIPGPPPQTIADGLRSYVGEIAFPVLQRSLEDILTVSEESIVEAMRLVWQTLKIIIEPSSAVVVAALLEHADRFRGQRVGLILSGGNVDLDCLPWRPASGT